MVYPIEALTIYNKLLASKYQYALINNYIQQVNHE